MRSGSLGPAAIAAVLLAAGAAACGGGGGDGAEAPRVEVGAGPGLAGAVTGPLRGGPGDQLAPSVRGDVLAYVDYARDENGACWSEPDDEDCAGTLRVVSLSNGGLLGFANVGDALPAVGDGFVAWVERPDQRLGEWRTRVRALVLSSQTVVQLSRTDAQTDGSQPPAVDGSAVAWMDQGWPEPGIRVRDVALGTEQVVPLQAYGGTPGLALGGGRLVYTDRDPSTWNPRVVVRELASGTESHLALPSRTDGREPFRPALAGDRVAYKLGYPWGCYDPEGDTCASKVIVHDLATGGRWEHASPTMSRYGPLLLTDDAVLWLDDRDGPYGLFGMSLPGGAATRVTPEGSVLSWIAPGAASDGQLVWADRRSGDFDVYAAALR